jgi:hypothetical protein
MELGKDTYGKEGRLTGLRQVSFIQSEQCRGLGLYTDGQGTSAEGK